MDVMEEIRSINHKWVCYFVLLVFFLVWIGFSFTNTHAGRGFYFFIQRNDIWPESDENIMNLFIIFLLGVNRFWWFGLRLLLLGSHGTLQAGLRAESSFFSSGISIFGFQIFKIALFLKSLFILKKTIFPILWKKANLKEELLLKIEIISKKKYYFSLK